MANAVKSKSDVAKSDPAPRMETSGTSVGQMILIGLVILGVAALIAYQFFGCAGCYS